MSLDAGLFCCPAIRMEKSKIVIIFAGRRGLSPSGLDIITS